MKTKPESRVASRAKRPSDQASAETAMLTATITAPNSRLKPGAAHRSRRDSPG